MFSEYELYLDSDGCVCDFDAYVETHMGKKISEVPKSEFWKWVAWHDKNVQPFFRNLPKMHDADILVDFLMKCNAKRFSILTARGNTPSDGEEQKIAWYAENYPGLECIVVRKSIDKAQYAHPKSILIDDRSKSIDPWIAAGGIGILHTSAENTIQQLLNILDI